jgi:hypothetical protein
MEWERLLEMMKSGNADACKIRLVRAEIGLSRRRFQAYIRRAHFR